MTAGTSAVVLFAAVMCSVCVVWLMIARSWGVLDELDDCGFTIATFVGSPLRVNWNDLKGPAICFQGFLPRVGVRVAHRRFSLLESERTVFLRGRFGEEQLVEKLRETVGV